MEVLSLTNKLLIEQMKKCKLFLAVAALLALGTTSCNKEEDGERLNSFYASSEEDNGTDSSKTYLRGTAMYWNANDSVKLWGSNDSRGYTYKAAYGNSTSTRFDYARTGNAPILRAPYVVGYPARYWTSKNVVTLPSTQNYVANGANYIPQYAYSPSSSSPDYPSLRFFNVCGLVRLNLTKPNTNISSISITTNAPIYGDFSISTSRQYRSYPYYDYVYIPSTSYAGNGGNTVTLVCSTPQSINSSKNFNIYIPARTYSQFEIAITTSDNRTITKRANSSIVVERSQITTITLNTNDLNIDDNSCLTGRFSVSANRQVMFASGNLQCVNSQWKLADHQYDYLGTYSSTSRDLFGWSTETTDFGMSTSTDNSDYSGDFWDWGTAINPGAANTPWRTLTDAEWTYLLSGRTNASNLWGMATITINSSTSVRGLILLPDDWVPVSGVPFAARGSVNANQLTKGQWEEMETNGAVFLPAAGNRNGTTLASTGANGNYWTATSASNTNAYYMGFASATPSANRSGGRHTGRAVRLVQDAN